MKKKRIVNNASPWFCIRNGVRLFGLILLWLCAGNTFAQNSIQGNPENARYYIDGYLVTEIKNGEFVYKLQRVTSQGIHFQPEVAGYHTGMQQPNEEIGYTFSHCTTDYPGGIDATLKFWKQDTLTGVWQYDGEVTQGSEQYKQSRNMLVMLVLDCTNSLKNDFSKVQTSAKQFIHTILSKCPDGNVCIGIIGFNNISNTDKTVFDILPLTAANEKKMIAFIDNELQLENNTALYYAMDKGCDILENYVQHLTASECAKYDNVSMVVFTDGLDNHSKNARKGLKNADEYNLYLADRVDKMRLMNLPLTRQVICVPGNDLSDTLKFYTALKSVASTTNGKQDFYLVREYSQLQGQFENIANDLISRWRDLVCYVPGGIETRVRWTLGELTPPPPVKEPKPALGYLRLPLLSFNIGTGGSPVKRFHFLDLSVGVDVALALKENFAIGVYGSYKTTFQTLRQVSFGLSTLIGPQSKNFLLGVGLNYRTRSKVLFEQNKGGYIVDIRRQSNPGFDFDLRLGGVFNVVYFFFDFTVGRYFTWDEFYPSHEFIRNDFNVLPQVNFNFGVNFIRIKKKNNK